MSPKPEPDTPETIAVSFGPDAEELARREAFREAIRAWLATHPLDPEPFRQEAWQVGCTAILHRHVKFDDLGFIDCFEARALLETLRYLGPDPSWNLAQIVFGRAVVEGDAVVQAALQDGGAVADFRAWLDSIIALPAAHAGTHLATIEDPEERGVAHLVAGRRQPELLEADWVAEAAAVDERIAHALALEIARHRPELTVALHGILSRMPWITLRGDADALLAALLAQHPAAPQQVLAPFEGYYGEATLVAAAAWHLEHGEHAAALELAGRIRFLSVHADRAMLIRGCALAEAGDPGGAEQALAAIDAPEAADALRLRLAELRGAAADLSWLEQRCRVCTPADAELLFRGLKCLLGAGRGATARDLCARHAEAFLDHPVLQPVIATVLDRARSGT